MKKIEQSLVERSIARLGRETNALEITAECISVKHITLCPLDGWYNEFS